ncbi:M61 family metallopeptidase [Adhaeribacter terrigena]|nr:peptidase M61 [Adhaeribacter terrigena]
MHILSKAMLLLAFSGTFFTASATDLPSGDRYKVNIDLTKVQDDKVPVTIKVPEIKEKEIIYNLPKIVPGTYSIYDFGKFLNEFKAYDKKGRELETERLDLNRWKIEDAKKLDKITYWVNDTWDTPNKEDIVFEPGGTNIEAGENFLINTHGFVGYFDKMKQVPYELTITKPERFYGATPLVASSSTATSDTYVIPSYMELVDSPLMYNKPDTTVLKIGNADVLVSVYAPSGKVTSKTVAKELEKVLNAQKNYLGGSLPVEKYAFLIYVAEKPNRTGAYGALEHSYSSVYYFPDMPEQMMADQVRNIAAHEFFHVVTPLSIHSEEIGNFDYMNPKMSQHLWLYEGVTEYFATHVQVNQKLIDKEEYLDKLKEYLAGANAFNDSLPFTEMSKGALDKHKKEYGNVYQKGALIGLALDIRLRELSDGKYGVLNLMKDLSKEYGKNKAFKDEELFDKIAQLTYPEIRDFFRKYVEGTQPLPLTEMFKKVGVNYATNGTEPRQTLGRFTIGFDPKSRRLIVADTENMNAFGKKMGFKKDDQLISINGEDMSPETAAEVLEKNVKYAPEGSRITVVVNRKNAAGKMQEVKLKGRLMKTLEKTENQLSLDPMATPKQKKLRDAWLYGGL